MSRSSCTAPKLAPNQPNGSSALASAMVAMDSQLQIVLEASWPVTYAWAGFTLEVRLARSGTHRCLDGQWALHNPCTIVPAEPSPNSTKHLQLAPSTPSFLRAQIVTGTCPGPLTHIEKRGLRLDWSSLTAYRRKAGPNASAWPRGTRECPLWRQLEWPPRQLIGLEGLFVRHAFHLLQKRHAFKGLLEIALTAASATRDNKPSHVNPQLHENREYRLDVTEVGGDQCIEDVLLRGRLAFIDTTWSAFPPSAHPLCAQHELP